MWFAIGSALAVLCMQYANCKPPRALHAHTHTSQPSQEAVAAGKWARGPWAGSDEEELAIKEETGATLRCIPFEQPVMKQGSLGWNCFYSGKFTHEVAIFAKSY